MKKFRFGLSLGGDEVTETPQPVNYLPVFRVGVFGPPVEAIDVGPTWYDWYTATQLPNTGPYLATYASAGSWTSWTNASLGTIDPSVDQSKYPATPDQVKWGQYQNYPAYTTHDPITMTIAGLEPGLYKVIVYGREHWAPFTAAGQRVFSIEANNSEPLVVDWAGDFGPLTTAAVTLETTVDESGIMNITFVGIVEAPTWDTIELLKAE